jgi:hypothetical protein
VARSLVSLNMVSEEMEDVVVRLECLDRLEWKPISASASRSSSVSGAETVEWRTDRRELVVPDQLLRPYEWCVCSKSGESSPDVSPLERCGDAAAKDA